MFCTSRQKQACHMKWHHEYIPGSPSTWNVIHVCTWTWGLLVITSNSAMLAVYILLTTTTTQHHTSRTCIYMQEINTCIYTWTCLHCSVLSSICFKKGLSRRLSSKHAKQTSETSQTEPCSGWQYINKLMHISLQRVGLQCDRQVYCPYQSDSLATKNKKQTYM